MPGTANLASRGSRLLAVLIDTIMILPIGVLIMYLMGMFETIERVQTISNRDELIYGVSIIFIWFLLHGYFLKKAGQTIGKRIVGIKIVSLAGSNAAMSALITRYLIFFIFQSISSLLSLLNFLFIFRDDRRCVHDLVAKTMVVYANK